MAEFEIKAGGKLDLLTRGEVRDVLTSWGNELTRGARLRRLSIQGLTDGAGALLMGANSDGPDPGMVWGITRLSVAPGPTLAASGLQVYANDVNPSGLLVSKLVTDLYPGDHGVIVTGGDSLRIVGTGITASTQVTVTLGIKEVPELMAWSL